MTGQDIVSTRPAAGHQPEWRTSELDWLDRCFASVDPVGPIVRRPGCMTLELHADNENANTRGWRERTIDFVAALAAAFVFCCLTAAAIVALYVVKSLLGIDLFAGHSLLHDWLYVRI